METRLDHRRYACSNFINKVRSRPVDAPQLIFAAYMRLINAKRDAYAEARLKILAELVFYARLAAKTHYH